MARSQRDTPRKHALLFTTASCPALSENTTGRPTFDRMEALICMAVALFVVVLIDGAMLAHARRRG
jgi:hypothetical protein